MNVERKCAADIACWRRTAADTRPLGLTRVATEGFTQTKPAGLALVGKTVNSFLWEVKRVLIGLRLKRMRVGLYGGVSVAGSLTGQIDSVGSAKSVRIPHGLGI